MNQETLEYNYGLVYKEILMRLFKTSLKKTNEPLFSPNLIGLMDETFINHEQEFRNKICTTDANFGKLKTIMLDFTIEYFKNNILFASFKSINKEKKFNPKKDLVRKKKEDVNDRIESKNWEHTKYHSAFKNQIKKEIKDYKNRASEILFKSIEIKENCPEANIKEFTKSIELLDLEFVFYSYSSLTHYKNNVQTLMDCAANMEPKKKAVVEAIINYFKMNKRYRIQIHDKLEWSPKTNDPERKRKYVNSVHNRPENALIESSTFLLPE